MPNVPAIRLALVATALLSSLACESTVTGNEGNFQFSYPADDRVLDFNKPIAIGARLDVVVRDAGDRSEIPLTDATTADSSILDVESFEGNSFTLLATGDGNVEVSVKGLNAAGSELTDSVNMLARTPEVHTLHHTCAPDSPTAAYLVGQAVYVPFEFTMANEQPVIGYGYYPVTPSTDAMVFDATFQGNQYMRFNLENVGSVSLNSDITDTRLDLEIIDIASITGIEEPTGFVVEDIDVGDTNLFYVRPMAGANVVCQSLAPIQYSADTPDICNVVAATNVSGLETATGNEGGWFNVTGVAAGTCSYTVTYPGGADGVGVSQQFSYTIEP
jgi:hypothetical protein